MPVAQVAYGDNGRVASMTNRAGEATTYTYTADDRACDRELGRCGLAITDIPGVPRGVTGCYMACGGDGSCPGLLACAADFAGHPGVCAPAP
jgi:hypothetical protein